MSALQLSIFICLTNTIFISFLFYHLSKMNTKDYLFFYSLGWLAFAVRCIMELIFTVFMEWYLFIFTSQVFAFVSAVMIFKGVCVYLKRKLPKGFILFIIFGVVTIVMLQTLGITADLWSVSLFIGIIIVWTAILIISHFQESILGKNLAGISYLLLGIFYIIYPVLWHISILNALAHYYFSTAALLKAIGFVIYFFEKISKDGTPITVEVNSSGVNLDGKRSLVSAKRDITERKKDEEALHKLFKAVEQSSSVIVITDVKGIIEYVNPGFSKVTGYSKNEVVGRNPRILKSGQQTDRVYSELWSTISSGYEWRGEFLNKRKNGTFYRALMTISPVKNNQGEIVNYIAVQEDITEIKNFQKNLYECNLEKEKILDELKSTKTRLIQQERLAASVTQEINNPLGFVASNFETMKRYLDILKKLVDMYKKASEGEKDAALDVLMTIRQSIEYRKSEFLLSDFPELVKDTENGLQRITDIVQSLKNFSRIDCGDIWQEYDLNEGIHDTLKIVYNEIEYHAEVETVLSDIPRIIANGGEINQVLLNMVINAVQAIKEKFGDEKGKIRLSTFHDEHKAVAFIIEDNGPSIPENIRQKIFSPFFATKSIRQGTELGVEIAYDIVVNKHHGEIQVDASDLGGTKFIVRLPVNGNDSD